MTLEDYEKELELVNKSKKKTNKIPDESSTLKDGISTWILLSGSNISTAKPEVMVSYRVDEEDKRKNNSLHESTTTKKKITTTTVLPKTTKHNVNKYNKNNLLTKVKVSEPKNATTPETTIKPNITKPTTRTTRKRTITTRQPFKKISVPVSSSTSSTTKVTTEPTTTESEENNTTISSLPETTTYLILEAKEADFNLPNDRAPSKKTKSTNSPAKKKKKNSSKKKPVDRIDSKRPDTKVAVKKPPGKPLTTQLYNYLAREVMPTVGVGLVGLVVTAGLATYFLGGPLTALRRSYDITNRKDDVAFDRIDEYSENMVPEEEMFGKVISGMPENSVYRNNIRLQTYRPKPNQQQQQPYSGYPQYSKVRYAAQTQPQGPLPQQMVPSQPNPQIIHNQNQNVRYRNVGYGETNIPQYPNQYANMQHQQQQPHQQQAKSSNIDYSAQMAQHQAYQQRMKEQQEKLKQLEEYYRQRHEISETTSEHFKVDVDSIELTTSQSSSQTEEPPLYGPYQDNQDNKFFIVEAEHIAVDPHNEKEFSQTTDDTNKHSEEISSTSSNPVFHGSEEDYQNSIANNILSKRRQFVVGSVTSVVPDSVNVHDAPQALSIILPEHGPRRRRDLKKKGKNLEDNEVDDVDSESLKEKQTSTESTPSSEKPLETNDINQRDGLIGLIRRIIELKLKMSINFLKTATGAFQEYLKGVESRVNNSTLFNSSSTNSSSENSLNKTKIS